MILLHQPFQILIFIKKNGKKKNNKKALNKICMLLDSIITRY